MEGYENAKHLEHDIDKQKDAISFAETVLEDSSKCAFSHFGFSRSVKSALCLAIAFTTLICLASPPCFATIDDARLLYVYAGYASGIPESQYFFQNIAWSTLISGLFRLFPAVNWYFAYHLALIVMSTATLFWCVLDTCERTKVKPWFSLGICCCFELLLFLNPLLMLHFEVTAALTGSAGILLMIKSVRDETGASFSRSRVSSILCMVLCFMQEKNTFYSCSVFFAIAWAIVTLVHFLHDRSRPRLPFVIDMCAAPAIILIAFLILSCANDRARSADWQQYLEYNRYRLSFTDYEHPEYANYQNVYDEIGWSSEFYDLTQRMYYMDERFSIDSISKVVNPFNRISSSKTLSLVSITRTIYVLLKNEPTARFHVLLACLLCTISILMLVVFRKSKRIVLEIIGCIIASFAACVLIAYLAWRGRLPLRAAEAVSLPFMFLMIGLLLDVFESAYGRQYDVGGITRRCKAISLSLLLASLIAMPFIVHQVRRYCEITGQSIAVRRDKTAEYRAIEQYASAHSESVFIYGRHDQNYGIDTLYSTTSSPTNLISWGTSYCFTPVWARQVECMGLNSLDSTSFGRSNVYFISYNIPGGADEALLLFRMLESDYGFTSYEVVDTIGEYHAVVHFT